MPQVWGTANLGGYMYSDELSSVLRTALQPMNRFRAFCDAKDATKKGLHRGDAFTWNTYSNIAVQGTDLVETNTMPESQFTVNQASLTVTEKGNSVPYTGKLDNLSLHPVSEIIHKVLKNDANKALDTSAHAQFNSTLLTVTPDGAAGDGNSLINVVFEVTGTPTNTNNAPLTSDHTKKIIDEMKERDIPVYDGRDYFALGRPTSFRRLKDDLESIHSYVDSGFQMIMHGEVGRLYEGCRFVEQTNIASEAWSNGQSDAVFFFGEDTVAEAVVIPEEIRGKIPSDYGRSMGVAWYYLGGFGIVHNQAGAVQNRIVKWDSAA